MSERVVITLGYSLIAVATDADKINDKGENSHTEKTAYYQDRFHAASCKNQVRMRTFNKGSFTF